VRGLMGKGLKGRGSYWRGSNRRPFPLTEREGEKSGEKKKPTGGTHLATRERGKGMGWLPGLARLDLGPGCGLGWAGLFLFFFFFVLFSFSFVF
jgi:hypothetical protein